MPTDPQLEAGLQAALAEAQTALRPGDPEEVLAALELVAERKGLALPAGMALDLDVEAMAQWPRDLFRRAFREVWENFPYRRMPEVPDFKQYIAAELAERRERLARLRMVQLKLERRRNDAEATPVSVAERQQVGERFGELARELRKALKEVPPP